MKKIWLGLLGVLMCGGCVQTQMLVLVSEDGSGVVTLNAQVSKAGIRQMNVTLGLLGDLGLIDRAQLYRALGIAGDELRITDVKQLFDRDALQELGRALGPGVELLRHQPSESTPWVGANAVYRFADVRNLRLGTGMDVPNGVTPWNYTFSYTPGTPNLLSVHPPRLTEGSGQVETALDMVLEAIEVAPGLDRLVKNSMKGAFLKIDLQVSGCVDGGNAEHLRGGNTLALADVRADKITSGVELLRVLSVRGPRDLAELHRRGSSGVLLQDPSVPLLVPFRACGE